MIIFKQNQVCHNYWHPLHLIIRTSSLCSNSTESSPVTSNKVVENRERNLRPFLFTESLQIIQSPRSSLVDLVELSSSAQSTGFQWGLGQGTEMAMAEA